MIFLEIAAIIALLLFFLFLGIISDAYDHWPVTTALIAGLIIACILWGPYTIFVTVLWANIDWIIIGTPVYLVVGLLWSFFQWDRFCLKSYQGYIKAIDTYKEKVEKAENARNKLGFDTPMDKADRDRAVGPEPTKVLFKPQWRQNKAKLIGWITYWPLSLFGFLVGEFFIEQIEKVINMFGNNYQTLTDKRFQD